MRTSLPAIVAALLFIGHAQPALQQGRPGAVDSRAPASSVSPSSVIRGRVVAADTRRPLRHALVSAFPDGSRSSAYMATTDENGTFACENLPAGRYRARASLVGYVSLEFGESLADSGGTDIVLGEREVFDRANFSLPRGGVITGRVVDQSGDPIEGVQVVPMSLQYAGGVERLTPVGGPETSKRSNDLGRYRIFGLQPGEYFVAATTGSFNANAPVYAETSGYAITYFPGSADRANAQAVVVSAAQETQADIVLAASRTFDVSGAVLGAIGTPLAGASVLLSPGAGGGIGLTARTASAGDGSFSFHGVAPGQYTLQAMSLSSPFSYGTSRLRIPSPASFATTIITVAGGMANVVLQARPSPVVTGRIVFEGGQPPGRPDGSIRIVASPVDFTRSPMTGSAQSRVYDDWTFDLNETWGPRLIDVVAPAGWALKAVRSGGIDVTDRPIDLERERGPLQVVLTNQAGGIAGNVTDEGRPAAHAAVIVFASDQDRWLFPSRFVARATSDDNGRFTVSPLPAADYRVIALRAVKADSSWQRPRFLASLVRDSERLALREGEHATLDLRIANPR